MQRPRELVLEGPSKPGSFVELPVPQIDRNVLFGDPRVPTRFWKKVYPTTDGCWVWTGAGLRYGHLLFDGEFQVAHRVFYKQLIGPILAGCLDHLCKVKPCVNPAHLEDVTKIENERREMKPACRRGHAWDAEPPYVDKHGVRFCRPCIRVRAAETQRRRLAKMAGAPND